MVDKIGQLLQDKPFYISKFLFSNYKKMNISDIEFIVLIYIINQNDESFNPKTISSELSISLPEVMVHVNSLCEKGIISLEIKKGNVRSEIINLNLLYDKLTFILMEKEEKETTLYGIFENEFGRTLSPVEYEIINAWKDGNFSDELIILALKEAIYNGVTNLRYIDKILHEWKKKGIKTKEDTLKNRKDFKENKKPKTEVFDYDWLNDE